MLTMFKFGCNAKQASFANGAELRDCNVSYDATFSASPAAAAAAAASAVPMLTRELVTRIQNAVHRQKPQRSKRNLILPAAFLWHPPFFQHEHERNNTKSALTAAAAAR